MENSEANNLKIKFYFQDLIKTWENFCRKHQELYDLTCEEYLNLLSSDIDTLEQTLQKKDLLLQEISNLESARHETIEQINSYIGSDIKIHKISELMSLMQDIIEPNEQVQLEKLNLLLIDIITKIQEQNKKNQLFLNKSILSLKELKSEFTGKKYETYSSKGLTYLSTK